MRTVRETCVPRPEVIEGELDDAIFAARLRDVVDGRAPDVYGDARTFFQNTHPAQRLKGLASTVFGRLNDPKEAGSVLRLSTGFGGGKTHALITLWHLANNVRDTSLGTEVLPGAGRPNEVTVAAVEGEGLGTVVAQSHGDIVTHSLWGELAYQLGGPEAYSKF